MEFKVVEESKNKLVFELKGETHTLCNALKKELNEVKGVEICAYRISHPLIGVPRFLIECNKETEPRRALKEALKSLKKKTTDFQNEVSEL